MNREILIVLGIVFGLAVGFISGRVRSDMVALVALLALQLAGVLTVPEAVAGFAHPVVIIIISMFIVSEALVYTGIAQKIGAAVLKAGNGSETRLIALLMLVVGIGGAFMNSTTAMAIFIPIAFTVARRAGLNRKRLLMPLSVAALISGMMTLIATAPNLIVAQVLEEHELESFGFFGFTPFGLCVLVVGIVYMLTAGRRLLSKDKQATSDREGPTIHELARSYGLAGKLYRLRISPESPLVDRAVARIQMRENYGLHIIAFEKHRSGRRFISHSSPETVFESGDDILVLGEPDRIKTMAEACRLADVPLSVPFKDESRRHEFFEKIGLAEIMLVPESKLIGKTLKELDFRSRYKATVLAVQRRGIPLTEGLRELRLDFGDVLLVNAGWREIATFKEEREDFIVLTLPEEFHEFAPAGKRSSRALLILGLMVVAMATRLLPTVTAAMLAAVCLIATRCVKRESVYRVINWQAVVLIAAIIPLATALDKSGMTFLISEGLVDTLGSLGPIAMLVAVFLVTAVTGSFMSNTATAVLLAPIAIDVAQTIGASPHAFAMTVAIACSAAYVTPVSSPVNILVQEPGGYRFLDFAKVGLPLLFLTMIVTVALAWFFYVR
jgi:di/tricarboxylate transporter